MDKSILILDTRDISYDLESILSATGFSISHPADTSFESVRTIPADIIVTDIHISLCPGTPPDHIIHSISPNVYVVFLGPDAPVSPPLSISASVLKEIPLPPLVAHVRKAVASLFESNTLNTHSLLADNFIQEFPNVISKPEFKCYLN